MAERRQPHFCEEEIVLPQAGLQQIYDANLAWEKITNSSLTILSTVK